MSRLHDVIYGQSLKSESELWPSEQDSAASYVPESQFPYSLFGENHPMMNLVPIGAIPPAALLPVQAEAAPSNALPDTCTLTRSTARVTGAARQRAKGPGDRGDGAA